MTNTGWHSSFGLDLNLCCINCGVWISDDRRDFDGVAHSCKRHPRTQSITAWDSGVDLETDGERSPGKTQLQLLLAPGAMEGSHRRPRKQSNPDMSEA